MPSPKQIFNNNIHPAELMLQIYSLLDTNDRPLSEGEMLQALRGIVRADAAEDMLLVYNEMFLGLIRECAHLPPSTLRRATLNHLLRQAVVAACTAMDTYLPALLKENFSVYIQALGRDFFPRNDPIITEYFQDMTFSLDDILRVWGDPGASEFIASKILGLTSFSYLSSRKGVHVTGRLLGLDKPWDRIAEHLGRDKKEMGTAIHEIAERRNNIVHRADRSREDPDGVMQEISYAWAQWAVDTVKHVCLTMDELVDARIREVQLIAGATSGE